MSAVTAPTGTSTGAAIVREMRSAIAINEPPNTAAIGIVTRCDGPNILLTTCGAIRSINPMTPAKHTAVPVIAADITSSVIFTL